MSKGAMPRRVAGGPGVQALLGIVFVALLLYGFYSYHGVKAGLRLTEENMARLKARHESLAAQMQVVYEHKIRLEKAVQEEEELHKKTKDELTMEKTALEERMRQVKNDLNEELIKTKKEHSELEGTLNDELHKVQSGYNKLQENCQAVENLKQTLQIELKTFQEQCQQDTAKLNEQSNQLKQQCANDIAQLKDGIADLNRRNAVLQMKLQNMSSPSIVNVTAIDNAHNKSLIEDQNVMQIAEPGGNKQKAYFEVRSPHSNNQEMVDANQTGQVAQQQLPLAQAGQVAQRQQPLTPAGQVAQQQQPLAQDGQVVQPNVESPDHEIGNSNNRTGIVAGAGGGEGIGADVSKIPDVPDNQIRDDVVNNRSYEGFDNAVDHTRQSSPEGVGQEGNPVPVQIPAPAQMELGADNSQSGVLAQPLPSNSSSQVLQPEQDFKKSQSASPGEIVDLAQAIPNANVTVEAQDEVQLNPDTK